MGKFTFIKFIKLIFHFLTVAAPMAVNMNRVLNTKLASIDDMFFILSIIIGLIIGMYWNTIKPLILKLVK